MKTHTLGATAPLNGYIKPTTTFVQIELESNMLTASREVKEITTDNSGENSLDFQDHDAFTGNAFDVSTNGYTKQ